MCDRFDPNHISQATELDEYTQTLTQVENARPSSSYLENIVDSGRHQWTFKIVERRGTVIIGIWRVLQNEQPPLGHNFARGSYRQYRGYGYFVSKGLRTDKNCGVSDSPYGVVCKDGDIVEMILDFDELSLSFKVNGTDYGKCHDVKQDKYRAAVFLYEAGCKIQLLESSTTKTQAL